MNKREVDELVSLIPARREGVRLSAAPERQPIPGGSGLSRQRDVDPGGGGGIASPLTEDVGTRTYHSVNALTSSDGLFVWEYQHIQQMQFTDGNGDTVVVNLEDDS